MDVLKRSLSDVPGGRILDVAAGRGNFTRILMDSFKCYDEVIAIDNCDSNKLVEAQKSFASDNVSFIRMNSESLEFENGFFDTVAISNSLHHMSRLDKVLGEMMRVLRPEGMFIINEMIQDNQTEEQLTHVLMHHWWAVIDTELGISHKETYRKHDILDMAVKLGLKILETLEYVEPVTDPKNPDEMNYMYKIIDEYCEKAKTLPDYINFKLQGDQLKKRINDVGMASATQVIIIGKK